MSLILVAHNDEVAVIGCDGRAGYYDEANKFVPVTDVAFKVTQLTPHLVVGATGDCALTDKLEDIVRGHAAGLASEPDAFDRACQLIETRAKAEYADADKSTKLALVLLGYDHASKRVRCVSWINADGFQPFESVKGLSYFTFGYEGAMDDAQSAGTSLLQKRPDPVALRDAIPHMIAELSRKFIQVGPTGRAYTVSSQGVVADQIDECVSESEQLDLDIKQDGTGQDGGGRAYLGFDANARLAGTFHNNPVNTQSQFTGANPLSNAAGNTTINIAANTQQFGDGQVSYNSGSVNPGVFGTFYVYADDPTFTGGAVTYQASTNPYQVTAANGRVYFGKITTLAGGGSGSGGDQCPCVNMFVRDDVPVSALKVGDSLDCLNPENRTTYSWAIEDIALSSASCCRLIAENGAEWEGSQSTPFTLPDRRSVKAIDMLGELVATDKGGNTPVVWSRVRSVEDIGICPVARIFLGGKTFAAGRDPHDRIYSHNVTK